MTVNDTTAYLYMVDDGYMVFRMDAVFLKFKVPKKLKEIITIKDHSSHCLVIDTNYGEEYIDLKAIVGELMLDIDLSTYSNIEIGRC